MLDYPGGFHVTTWAFNSRRGKKSFKEICNTKKEERHEPESVGSLEASRNV